MTAEKIRSRGAQDKASVVFMSESFDEFCMGTASSISDSTCKIRQQFWDLNVPLSVQGTDVLPQLHCLIIPTRDSVTIFT